MNSWPYLPSWSCIVPTLAVCKKDEERYLPKRDGNHRLTDSRKHQSIHGHHHWDTVQHREPWSTSLDSSAFRLGFRSIHTYIHTSNCFGYVVICYKKKITCSPTLDDKILVLILSTYILIKNYCKNNKLFYFYPMTIFNDAIFTSREGGK